MYYQRNIPSPARIYSFTLQNFVGGLNNRDQLPLENQATDVMNMSFTQDGVMEKRKGTKFFDSLNLGEPITWIDEFKPHKEDNVMVRATRTKVYIGDALIRNVTGQIHGINHMGKYMFCDGKGLWAYGRFDETAGTYVRIEGTQTTNYVLMEIVSPPEGFTPLGDEHKEGVRVLDFTNRKVWYEPCNQEIKDTFKQGNVVPKDPRFIVAREGRLYLAGSDEDDDNVFISDTGNPYYFPASLPMQLPPNSDRIAGLAVYNDAIVVGRRLDIHAIIGDTNRTDMGLQVFTLEKLNSHFGFASQRSVRNAHNYLFFLGSDSQFYILKSLDLYSDKLSTQVISKTVNIHGAPISVQKDDIWNASSCFHDDNYYTAVGDKIMVYNYLHQAWTVFDQINATSMYVLFDTLMMGDKNGRTLVHSEDFLDTGKPFMGYWRSRWFDMGDANSFKMFRDFFITSRSKKEYVSNVNLKFEVDYNDVDRSVDVSTNFSIYGKTRWGERYINREISTSLPFMIYRRGRQIRITFSNGEWINKEVANVSDLENILGIYDGMLIKVLADGKIYVNDEGAWRIAEEGEYNQGMCVLQLNGEYETKWKR